MTANSTSTSGHRIFSAIYPSGNRFKDLHQLWITATKETGHLRNSSPDGGSIHTQTLQTKGQLMPDFIGDDLAVGILHHETDFLRTGCGYLPRPKAHR